MLRKIIISGASNGLGASLAIELSSPNTHLLLLARRAALLESVAELCRNKGARVTSRNIDLRQIEKVKLVVSEFASGDGIEMLIANAGSLYLESNPKDYGISWHNILNQVNDNLVPTLSLLESVLCTPVEKRLKLHCVVISSLNAFFPVGEAPGYCIAKYAQKTLVDVLEDYYACRKSPIREISFSTVFPGFINTNMGINYPGPRPFEYSSQKAAVNIAKAINKKKRYIFFPKRLAFLIFISKLLPASIVRYIIRSSRAYIDPYP